VIRIALQRMLVLLRLVIVMSLAAYSLPTVSFAMHGDASASYPAVSTDSHAEGAQAEQAQAEDGMEHHDHGKPDQTAGHDGKSANQDCCSDFCLNAAIVGECQFTHLLSASVVRVFLDDSDVFGQLSSLQRPPSSRT
jgi:hypothetical protein